VVEGGKLCEVRQLPAWIPLLREAARPECRIELIHHLAIGLDTKGEGDDEVDSEECGTRLRPLSCRA
jgi:hypothetical protein